MDLREAFVESAHRWGDRETILEGDRGFKLSELAAGVAAMSDLLRSADRSQTGHVGLLLPNTHASVPAFFGAIFAGKVPVPMNPQAPPAELGSMISATGIQTVLTLSPLRRSVEALAREGLAGLTAFYLDEMGAGLDDRAKSAPAGLGPLRRLEAMLGQKIPDVACMLFSSGTTGQPKAVMLTHRNLMSNFLSVRQVFDYGPQDTVYGLLPLFHSFGLFVFNLALFGGPRFVMASRFVPLEALRAIEKYRITIFLLVPQIYQALTRTDTARSLDWSSVRICLAGGAATPKALREAWKELTGRTLYQGYGLTENSPVVSLCVPESQREGSVGKPMPGVEVKIVDEDEQSLEPGRQGEVWVRGPSVMKGYYNNPQATRETVDPAGWLHTGDYGLLDEDNFLFISGRKKDIIIVAGENVHPSEIEEALLSHPDVGEACVVGVPDEAHGEVPKGFVVLKPERRLDSQALRVYLRDRLAPYKIPREIVALEQLPKNTMGKVLKRQLPA